MRQRLLVCHRCNCCAFQKAVYAARRIASAMVETWSPDGVLLYQNNGEAVGQEVPHFHLHVVPRRLASNWTSGPPQLAPVVAGERAAHADYARITDTKIATVLELQKHLGKQA
jgi:diadenosine tetraphosphate (Ap4A) HIT family hydrolase